jgi:hypothetical protein
MWKSEFHQSLDKDVSLLETQTITMKNHLASRLKQFNQARKQQSKELKEIQVLHSSCDSTRFDSRLKKSDIFLDTT